MQRLTISIDDPLAQAFDEFIRARGYENRSESVRDLMREAVKTWRNEGAQAATCVATLSYIYDSHTRGLAQRLADIQHDHHDLVVSATVLRLDHDQALESLMLKGPVGGVRAFSDRIRAERGVRFGALNLIGVELNDDHAQTHGHSHRGHPHLSPRPA